MTSNRSQNCGPIALSAVLGIKDDEAYRLMPEFETLGFSTSDTLKAALDRAGRKWRDIGTRCPSPGAFGLVALRFGEKDTWRHRIAVRNDGSSVSAFDNHSLCWMRIESWERLYLPGMMRNHNSRRCWIDEVIEVEPR